MEQNHTAAYKSIIISLMIGFTLAILPLPAWATRFRPDWIALILLYWIIHTPNRVGITSAFICGILLDLAYDTLLGQHAFGLVIISFIAYKFHQRVRVYPVTQQSLFILLLLLIKQLLILWIYGITQRAPSYTFIYFSASFMGMLLWPVIVALMEQIRRKSA